MKKTLLFLGISSLIFLAVFCLALMVGKYSIGFNDFITAIFTNDKSVNMERSIIINLRLPRTIMAGLTGIALSVSGLLYQEIFQNKLVSPDLLGVSHGAGAGAAFAIVLGFSSVFISISAFMFGIITVFVTLLVSKIFRNKSSTILLLSGIIVGGFMQAILSLIKYIANPETQLSDITYWLMGSFADSTMKEVRILLPIVLISVIFLLCISWKINIVALGREEAQTKGTNYVFYRTLIIVIATLLTASSVAFSGTISWIWLVIPHIVRIIIGKNTTRSIPLTCTFGGIFMIVVDILSRSFTGAEIPLSAVTGLFGTIIFITLLFMNRRKYYER